MTRSASALRSGGIDKATQLPQHRQHIDPSRGGDFLIVDELTEGESLILFKRSSAIDDEVSMGRFPAPDPWLAHVLPY
jgi:hypothetical protein